MSDWFGRWSFKGCIVRFLLFFLFYLKGTIHFYETHEYTWLKKGRISQNAGFHLQSPGQDVEGQYNTYKRERHDWMVDRALTYSIYMTSCSESQEHTIIQHSYTDQADSLRVLLRQGMKESPLTAWSDAQSCCFGCWTLPEDLEPNDAVLNKSHFNL